MNVPAMAPIVFNVYRIPTLSPTFFIPGLLGLVVMGLLIEQIQPLTGRSKDFEDFVANTIGIGVGAGVGLMTRFIYSLIRKELTTYSVRRNSAVIGTIDALERCVLLRNDRFDARSSALSDGLAPPPDIIIFSDIDAMSLGDPHPREGGDIGD